jgi:hypothetical protein
MEFRTRPKTDYLQNAELQELHVLTSHWQSDMDFFADELRFINFLFDKYFHALTEPENMEKTKAIAAQVSQLNSTHQILVDRIKKQIHHIESAIANPGYQDTPAFRSEHVSLEDDITTFHTSFKILKRQVFELTELIARSEKAKHLISQ